MTKISEIAKASQSKAFKALNPQFFGVPSHQTYKVTPEPSKAASNDSGAIAPHSIAPSKDESKLNKTEKAYLSFLRSQNPRWIGIQCISLKLGDDCRYNPDFLVLNASGFLEVHEVKGFMREDALVKLKVAARMYRFLKFIVVKKAQPWSFQTVSP